MKKHIITIILIISFISIFVFTKIHNNSQIEYPVEIQYKIVNEGTNNPNGLKEWIYEHKTIQGVFQTEFEGNTYILYSMGKQIYEGYGLGSIKLNETDKDEFTLSIKKVFSKNVCIPIKPYYPIVTLEVKGKLKNKVNLDVDEVINIDGVIKVDRLEK